jgi:hypothetical protein
MFIWLILLLQSFVFQVKTDACELTTNERIELITSQFFQSRQFCSTVDIPTANTHRVSITGQLVDYTTNCKKSINNANIEIIHIRQNIHSICQEVHHPNAHGYFNLTTTVTTPLTEEILVRVTAFGYKTVVKQIPLSASQERSEDLVLNLQIVLTVDMEQIQTQQKQRMKSMVDDLISNMTLEEKLGQLNLALIGFNQAGPVVSQNVTEKIRRGLIGAVAYTYTPKAVRILQELAINSTRLKIPLISVMM